MKENYVIIFYNGNWADEIDIQGYWYTTKETYESWLEDLNDVDYPYYMCLGPNQDIEYEDKNAILSDLKAVDITKEQYEALEAIHCSNWYGDFPDPEPKIDWYD